MIEAIDRVRAALSREVALDTALEFCVEALLDSRIGVRQKAIEVARSALAGPQRCAACIGGGEVIAGGRVVLCDDCGGTGKRRATR